MNFQKLKAMMESAVADFDNAAVESVDYFRQNNPSAENVARYIYEKLQINMPGGVKLRSVSVTEEPGCSAEFSQ